MGRNWWVPFIFGFIAGLVTGYLVANSPVIEFENKLPIGVLVQSAVTLVTAILVTAYLQNLNQADRFEKDSCIDQINELRQLLKKVNSLPNKAVYADVVSLVKSVNTTTNRICDTIKLCRFSSKFRKLRIELNIPELRDLTTSTPPLGSEANFSKVVDGEISWSPLRKNEINLKILELEKTLTAIQLKINRC